MECKNCKIETKNAIFCSSSCSATYNNKLRRKEKNCLACSKKLENNWQEKYCSNSCQQEYRYQTVIKFKITLGQINSVSSQKRYITEEKGYKCAECQVGNEYNSKKLTLQLDHIDGNSDNNLPVNLRLLCPNCHSQTPNFCSLNKIKDTRRNRYFRAWYRNQNKKGLNNTELAINE